jgi:hypothetical protein
MKTLPETITKYNRIYRRVKTDLTLTDADKLIQEYRINGYAAHIVIKWNSTRNQLNAPVNAKVHAVYIRKKVR